ncbi:DUF4190 domain-containing protein [Streptomyces sp. NPDC000410]|uniref:DUF4190 domain-containing protein n=1 Tax=Streptomyces sp. NPDC000410 TaxID=3154254 RepID=UPI003322DFF3
MEPPSQGWTPPSDPTPPSSPAASPPPSSAYASPYVHPALQPHPPFGGPHVPPAPSRPPFNGLSIASLVLGIVCCLAPVGLVLGIVALVQVRKKGERGRGMAVSGTIVSLVMTVLLGIVIGTGGAGDFWDGMKGGFRDARENAARSRSTMDLRMGDCFDARGDGELAGEAVDVTVLDCSKPHDGEVFATLRIPRDGDFPGDPDVQSEADERCFGMMDDYAQDTWLTDTLPVYYYVPTRQSWRQGDRAVVCVFGRDPGQPKLTKSLRLDDSNLDDHQLTYLRSENAVWNILEEQPLDEFEDAEGEYRAWAERCSALMSGQASLLRRHEGWPAAAAGPVKDRAAQLDAAKRHWDRAADAQDWATFSTQQGLAVQALREPTEVAVRGALGLSTTPPDPYGDSDDESSGESSGDSAPDSSV